MSFSGYKSKYAIHLCALDGSFPAGSGPVLNASAKDFVYNIDSGRQMTWAMTLDNPRTPYILNNDCLAKVYRQTRLGTWQLLMVGDVVSLEEQTSGDIGTLTCIAADPFWRLNQRWIGTSTDTASGQGLPYQDPPTTDTAGTTTDLSTMIVDLLANANEDWNTGIELGTVEMTGQESILGPIYVQQTAATIQSVCALDGGPDFEVVPVEPTGAWPDTIIAEMNVLTHLGFIPEVDEPPNATFQYGFGNLSIASYDRIITKSNLANRVLSLPQGFPSLSAADDTTAQANDTTSQANRGLFVYVDNSGVISLALRDQLVAGDLAVMSVPQQQLSITLVPNPSLDFGVDYNVGDVCGAQAYDKDTDTIRFNGTIRLYGVELTTDDNELETVTLTLTPDNESGTTFPDVPGGIFA